jgi:hypothetical protein
MPTPIPSPVGNRFVDLFLFAKKRLAPWRDTNSRRVFWTLAVALDGLSDSARQAVRIWMAAPEWPSDAIKYVARNRGMLVPRMTDFDWRGWLNNQWAQHAIAGTWTGTLAGIQASSPLTVTLDAASGPFVGEGGWSIIVEGDPLEWDDGGNWDEGNAWDVDRDVSTAIEATRFWGPAKCFYGVHTFPTYGTLGNIKLPFRLGEP